MKQTHCVAYLIQTLAVSGILLASCTLTGQAVKKEEPKPPVTTVAARSTEDPEPLNLGRKAIDDAQWAQAVRLLDIYLDQPDASRRDEALYLKGMARYKLGDLDEAKMDLEEVIEDFPGSEFTEQAFAVLAMVQEARGQGSEGPVEVQNTALEAFSALCDTWRDADPAAKPAAMNAIEEYLDGNVSVADMRAIASKPPADPPLDALVKARWGLLSCHIGETATCRQVLEGFVRDYPEHPLKTRVDAALHEAQQRETVTASAVGVILPMSGKYAAAGKRLWESVQMGAGAFKEDTARVTLVLCDSESKPSRAAACVDKLVLDDHVIGIVGPATSDNSQRAAYRAQWFGVPMISLSQRDELPEIGDYVFRMALTTKLQAWALVKYATETLKLNTFAVLYPQNPYGISMMNHFWDAVNSYGGKITAIDSYPNGTTDFTNIVKEMVGRMYPSHRYDYIKFKREERDKYPDPYRWRKATEEFLRTMPPIVDFDAVFIPDFAGPVSYAIPALAFEGIDFHTTKKWKINRKRKREQREKRKIKLVWLMGGSGWNSQKLLDRAGKHIEESVFCDGFYADADAPNVKAFTDEYQKRYSRTPSVLEAYAYDAATLLSAVLLHETHPESRAALRTSLLGLSEFYGVTGSLHFDASGELESNLVMLSYYDGQVVPADQVGKEDDKDDKKDTNKAADPAAGTGDSR